MARTMQVSPVAWDSAPGPYDAVFVTLGYEERARHVASRIQWDDSRKVAWAFDENTVLSYAENKDWFETNGFEVFRENDGDPLKWVTTLCAGASGDCVRVAIDISSATRRRMARLLEACALAATQKRIEVDFWYSMAKYTQASAVDSPNIAAGPVLPSFAGWSIDPDAPTCLILGLGYEQDQAIGAVEYIEPAQVIVFDPSGQDPSYSTAIEDANAQLWKLRPVPPRRVFYDPSQGFSTFMTLDGLLAGLVRRSRPVLLPFGPKIFALAALLAARFHPACAVWRVSAGSAATPVQRTPNGTIVGLRAVFTI